MPRPSWHSDLNHLKFIPLFSWTLNAQLLRSLNPSRVPTRAIQLARQADHDLRTDSSGWSGPRALALMFTTLKNHRNADICNSLVLSLLNQGRIPPIPSYRTAMRQWPPEPSILPPELLAELESAHDPEPPLER